MCRPRNVGNSWCRVVQDEYGDGEGTDSSTSEDEDDAAEVALNVREGSNQTHGFCM